MNEISAGVQILIDQLKTNPEEFFGPVGFEADGYLLKGTPRPKFSTWKSIIEDDLLDAQDDNLRVKTHRRYSWFLTDAEKTALVGAYREARRQRFDAEIIADLHAKPEPYREIGSMNLAQGTKTKSHTRTEGVTL